MNLLSSQYIVNILVREMGLPAGAVWVRNQNQVIPNDNGLYISVGIVWAFPVGNSTYMVEETSGDPSVAVQHQISQLQQRENVQIDIWSRSNDGITRWPEVIMAMQSFYAQQQQELNNFKIARIPQSITDTSYAEGGSQLNRYTIVQPVLVWYRKDTILNSPLGDYYDNFTTRADDETTIGTDTPLLEFNISSVSSSFYATEDGLSIYVDSQGNYYGTEN